MVDWLVPDEEPVYCGECALNSTKARDFFLYGFDCILVCTHTVTECTIQTAWELIQN